MSDVRSMNREYKKRQLRSNIVQLPRQPQAMSDEEDSEEVIRQVHSKRMRRRLLLFLLGLLVLGTAGYCGYRYFHEYEYTEYSVGWETAMRYSDAASASAEEAAGDGEAGGAEGAAALAVSESGFVRYASFGENMIRYTKDGATYIDADGKSVWTQGYEMKTPVIHINGNFAVIADQQGNDLYICDTSGCTGSARTQLPITKAAVSAQGVTAVIVEDAAASYIFYYKKNGEDLRISIKMLLSGDGYPVDLALSPDGRQIVMSVMYMKNGALKNKVVFYDFSEIGKNVNNRFVGAFEEEFDDKLAGRVRYLNDETVCAFSDKGLTFISVRNVIPDTNVISVPVEEEIESICYSDRYAGIVVDNPSGDPYRMDVYSTSGSRVASFGFDYSYTGVEIDGDRVILYNGESCRVYNLDGNLKFEGTFDYPVSLVRSGKNRSRTLIVAGSEKMQEIVLK